jgi:hypothetical protein
MRLLPLQRGMLRIMGLVLSVQRLSSFLRALSRLV